MKREKHIKTKETSNKNVQSYIESDKESNKGHKDTRNKNFKCANPDPRLGCDPGIDVAG